MYREIFTCLVIAAVLASSTQAQKRRIHKGTQWGKRTSLFDLNDDRNLSAFPDSSKQIDLGNLVRAWINFEMQRQENSKTFPTFDQALGYETSNFEKEIK